MIYACAGSPADPVAVSEESVPIAGHNLHDVEASVSHQWKLVSSTLGSALAIE